MSKIKITTECVSGLPKELIRENDIDIIYYEVETESGIFYDTLEVDGRAIMEYMSDGVKKAHSIAPSKEDYVAFFKKNLERADEVIHLSIGSGLSEAYANAWAAAEEFNRMGTKVHIIDTKHLSSGQGILVLEAARLAKEGRTAQEIENQIMEEIPMISSTFITYNADYLYYNGKVSKDIKNMCNVLNLHPLIAVDEDGKLKLAHVFIGNYERCSKKYIRSLLKRDKIRTDKPVFITHAGCSQEKLHGIEEQILKENNLTEYYIKQASAAVSSNCGPNAFGILYMKEGGKR